jgi:dTDP-4-dehydrorhamnose 3,5-epimerase
MKFTPSEIPPVVLIEPRVYTDERGFIMETYQSERFAQAGITAVFLQDNHSASRQGALRGLHYQIRQAQGKLVRVIVGEVFDVAVDMRRHSPYFGKWVGAYLSAENKHQIWIPPGFALICTRRSGSARCYGMTQLSASSGLYSRAAPRSCRAKTPPACRWHRPKYMFKNSFQAITA